MARDYAKFVPPKPRSLNYRSWRVPLFFALFLTLLAFLAVTYSMHAKKSDPSLASHSKLAAVIDKLANAFSHHTTQLKATAAKAVAMTKTETPPPVQFDFYNQLPSMQVSLPDEAQSAKPPVDVSKPTLRSATTEEAAVTQEDTVAFKDMHPDEAILPVHHNATIKAVAIGSVNTQADAVATAVTETDADADVQPTASPVSTSPSIISPDEITSQLAADNAVMQYAIQVGVFATPQAAARLQTALADVGFTANIVKIKKNGHTEYHVQQGPFATKDLAKAGQESLQKRGIVSILRKLT